MADLDTSGDGVADTGAALAALSITDAERQRLAMLYQPGQGLWRVLIPHFSPWDCNWPLVPPDGAVLPDQDPDPNEPCDSCKEAGSSVIDIQNQLLGEVLGVVGTGFGMHYQSDLARGYRVAYTLEIPLIGTPPPNNILRRIELEIQVAGRLFQQSFGPEDNQRTTFTWDGKDAYGRTLDGPQPITVRIGYTYQGTYAPTSRFGLPGNGQVTTSPAREEVTLWRTWTDWIGTWHAASDGLRGWSLSAHHSYVPTTKVLFRGDGRRESPQTLGPTIDTVAGGPIGPSGDGGPATAGRFQQPREVAFGPDGSLYIADSMAQNIRRVAPNGIISTVAGNGLCLTPTGPCGDGGLATEAKFTGPVGIAVGPDNSLYIADSNNNRIRRVGPDGIITTIAGTGERGFSGDGGPATLAEIGLIRGFAVGRDGSLYLAGSSNYRVRRVTPDGIIRTIAGTGVSGFSGDGGPATQARLGSTTAVAVGPDDSVYVVDQGNNRIRWFRPGGQIDTLAGNGVAVTSGDGGLATRAALQNLDVGIAVGPESGVYFTQFSSAADSRVRRISPIGERFVAGEIVVPAEDSSEIYLFTLDGRHLRTLDALTGALRYQFSYAAAGRLASVTDCDGNVTSIERDGQGRPTAIVGPFGQRTALEVDTNGYLSRVTNPVGEAVQLAHTTDGLLTGVTWPGGQASGYAYDILGRLVAATDPTGATKTLTRIGINRDFTVTLTSPLGQATSYRVERLRNGDTRLTTTDCASGQAQAVIGLDGRVTGTDPEGITRTLVLGLDPRWGMRAPLAASQTTTTSNGLVSTMTTQRTATLAGPGQLLNLSALKETVTINGRAWTNTYDGPSRTLVSTSPAGRRGRIILDGRGRPVQAQLGDLDPIAFTYDNRGRLATGTQGQGAGARVAVFAYGPDGFLASVTDPLGRTAAFTNDPAGRVTAQTLSDGRVFGFAYDSNGNVRGVTPPGRPEHAFAYTLRDDVAAYHYRL